VNHGASKGQTNYMHYVYMHKDYIYYYSSATTMTNQLPHFLG